MEPITLRRDGQRPLSDRPDQVGIVVSTTERLVDELPDGTKRSTFRFVQFRPM